MADIPSPSKVAGPFMPQFEIYWKRLDPNNTGRVAPMDAAKFLKSSGLSDHTLGKVWDLSDHEGRGFLDKQGLFIACKLVALSQANRELLLESILDESPAPNFGDLTAPGAKVAAAPRGTPAPSINFLVKPEEKRKYDALFNQLKPTNGILPGDKVRNVMLGSKLPMSMLGKIWDLADQDKDGNLDRYEFTVAMHLVYRALQDDTIPDQLPAELSKEKVPQPLSAPVALPELHNGATPRLDSSSLLVGPTPILSIGSKPNSALLENNNTPNLNNLNAMYDQSVSKPNLLDSPQPTLLQPSTQSNLIPRSLDPVGAASIQAVPWVVNAGDRLRYEALFKQTDNDKDGFVSGVEIKNLFLQTGLQQNILAHIWNLCDMRQEGKLNPEQFALAMYLVQQKQAGKDPPAALTPDMVPPSMRPKGGAATSSDGNRSVYNNPELEAMAKEIQELMQEKMMLEREVQDQEYNIQARGTESHSLQSEFDTLNSTLTQLTNQKNVAQKRLDDLDVQIESLRMDSSKMVDSIEEELTKITKLRGQANEQEASLKAQEEEVHGKKRELEVLIEEEKVLGSNISTSQKEIETLVKALADIDFLLGETRGKSSEMEEADKHMAEAIARFDKVLKSDDPSEAQNCPDLYLEPIRLSFLEPDYSKIDKPSRPPPRPQTFSPVANGRISSNDDPFSDMSPETRDPTAFFSNDDAFANFTANDTDGGETPPVLVPRPGDTDSPTPALPPKKQAAAPKRPPPPRRPPPPKAGPALAEPGRPPLPKHSPDSDDPFAEENAFSSNGPAAAHDSDSGAGGFADFGAFQSTGNKSGFGKNDNAFFDNNWNTSSNSSGLDFSEDPFKNSNVRYADPFGMEDSDPFSSLKQDPFKDASNGFGSDPFSGSAPDPFSSTKPDLFSEKLKPSDSFGADPFRSNSNDPFGGKPSTEDPYGSKHTFDDPFGSKPKSNDPFGSKPSGSDPFSSPQDMFGSKKDTNYSNDPFGTSFATSNPDPFPASDNSFSNDPFSLTTLSNLTSSKDLNANSNQPVVSSTSSTLSYRKEVLSSSSSTERSSKKRPGHGIADFLTGSPAKTDKKKEKKNGKFHLSSPLKSKSKDSPKSDKKGSRDSHGSDSGPDQVQLKMAAEMSKREEVERRRRLQLQEEQELAYAIALSKAEAASLNNQ